VVQPDAIVQFVQLAVAQPEQVAHFATGYVVDKGVDLVTDAVIRVIRHRLLPRYRTEQESLRDDLEALRDIVESLAATVDRERLKSDWRADRATERFIGDAIEGALETPFRAKRLLLGRLIAERLTVETESTDDQHLRESLRIVRESNQAQLFALGALFLVQHPPDSPLMDAHKLASWWDTELLPLLELFVDGGWTTEDLAYLGRLGAVMDDGTATSANLRVSGRPGPMINNVLQRHGMPYADTHHYPGKEPSAFAIYTARLHAGSAKTTKRPALAFALYPYHLTVPGQRAALAILDSLSFERNGVTMAQARTSDTYPFSRRA
jgi:hypothetical protein